MSAPLKPKCRALQKYRRPTDVLSTLSSLASLESSSSNRETVNPRKKPSLALNLEDAQMQPLPLGIFSEKDKSVQKALSQDWLRTTYSPRGGKSSPRGSFGSFARMGSRAFHSVCSLQSIPEEHDEKGLDNYSREEMAALEKKFESLGLTGMSIAGQNAEDDQMQQ